MRTTLFHRARRAAMTGQLLVAGFTVAACSGGGGGGDATAIVDMTPPPPDLYGADLKDNDYPRGPYGKSGSVRNGNALPDFSLQGYFSPTATNGLSSSKPFGEVTFGMLHDSGKRYALIHLAAFW
jgi:hypothetical protein